MFPDRYGINDTLTAIYSGLRVKQTGMVEGHVPQGVGVQVPPSALYIPVIHQNNCNLPYMGVV